jgi:hypothetical protein
MRVIDVQENCLTDKPPQDCRYVTLSYVWGGPQQFSLKVAFMDHFFKPISLSADNEELPWTIRDFFTVVARLGLRYA